jgi:uncharacterized protein YbcI
MSETLPTRGQLERALSQRIQAVYRNQTGHRPEEVVCQIFDQRIAIVLENATTQVEQLLAETGKAELVEEVHSTVKDAIEPHMRQVIEEVVGVSVVDLLSDAKLETERTGMIALLSEVPQMREKSGNGNLPREGKG